MKTQNTLENKSKFFAQYWGQEVLIANPHVNQKNPFICEQPYIYHNTDIAWLELTPLSQISDEDVSFVAKVCHQVPNLNFEIKRQDDIIHATNRDKYGIESHICINFKYATINCNIRIPDDNDKPVNYSVNIAEIHMSASRVVGYIQSLDYLRSKGYALPYMDLSVEDLVEYGWVKLKEE